MKNRHELVTDKEYGSHTINCPVTLASARSSARNIPTRYVLDCRGIFKTFNLIEVSKSCGLPLLLAIVHVGVRPTPVTIVYEAKRRMPVLKVKSQISFSEKSLRII
jgi:hypothetical protein